MSKPIPIAAAEQVAKDCALAQVIVIGWGKDNKTHVTTYGVTAEDKIQAGRGGDLVSEFLQLPRTQQTIHADFRLELDAGLFREALDLLGLILGRNGTTAPMVRQAERILKAAGRGVRSA